MQIPRDAAGAGPDGGHHGVIGSRRPSHWPCSRSVVVGLRCTVHSFCTALHCLPANGSVLREGCTNSAVMAVTGTTTTRNVIFIPSAKFQTSSRQLEPASHPVGAFLFLPFPRFYWSSEGFSLRPSEAALPSDGEKSAPLFFSQRGAPLFDGAPHCGRTRERNDNLKRSSGSP